MLRKPKAVIIETLEASNAIQPRRYTRYRSDTMVLLQLAEDQPDLIARVEDWSPAGLRIVVPASVKLPRVFHLSKLKRFGLGDLVRCELVWRTDSKVGVKFLRPEDAV